MRERVLSPELMDEPGLDPELLRAALVGLRRLNRASMCGPFLWRLIAQEAQTLSRPIRVLDVACASGDWVIDAARRARTAGIRAEFSGCDLNTASIELAEREARSKGVSCSFFARDAIRGEGFGEYDVVVSSLFLHHLTDADAVSLLSRMRRSATRLVVVNDLVRSRLNLWMVGVASRMLTRSPIVHSDAMISMRAAFTRSELLKIAEQAGLHGATMRFGGFGRMMLSHRRGA